MESEIIIKEVDCFDSTCLDRIGKLRYDVWLGEKSLDQSMFPNGSWLDPSDEDSILTRHFVAEVNGELVAAARLVTHTTIASADVDIDLWMSSGKKLVWPVSDLGRLVVRRDYRNRGIAKSLNTIRMNTARSMGVGSIIVTASAGNSSLLKATGFVSIGEEIVFPNRPATTFYALQYTFFTPHFYELVSNELIASEIMAYLPEAQGILALAQASRTLEAAVLTSGAWGLRLKRACSWAPVFTFDEEVKPKAFTSSCVTDGNSESNETNFSLRRQFKKHVENSFAYRTGSLTLATQYSGHVDGACCLAMHPNYEQDIDEEANAYAFSGVPFLASGSMDGSILLHEHEFSSGGGDQESLATVSPVAALMGHSGAVTAIRWMIPETLLSASYDGTLKAWDVESPKGSHVTDASATWQHGNGNARILALDCQPRSCGHLTVTGGLDGLLGLHDFRLQRQVSSFSSGESCVYSVAISSVLMLAGTSRGGVQIYDLRKQGTSSIPITSNPVSLLETRYPLPSGRPIAAITLAGNCFAAGCKDGDIAISQVLRTSTEDSNDACALLCGHDRGIRSLAFAQGGGSLVSSSNDCTIRLWNISDISSGNHIKACSDLISTSASRSHGAQVPQVIACRSSIFSASIDKMVMRHRLLVPSS